MRSADSRHGPGVLVVASALLLLGLGGCASAPQAPQPAPQPPPQSQAELEFQAGAKRPPTAKTLYALSQILAAQGKDDQAREIFERITTEHPDFLPAYCALAELHMRNQQIEQAMRILNSGLQRAPNEAIFINDLGMCQMIKGNYGAALQLFTRACSLAPDSHRYRSNLAAILGLLGRYDEALSLYFDVMSPADAHYNVAILCDARHDAPRASAEYQKAAVLGKHQ